MAPVAVGPPLFEAEQAVLAERSPQLWPVTPLGIPNVPPPLPPLPDCVLTPAMFDERGMLRVLGAQEAFQGGPALGLGGAGAPEGAAEGLAPPPLAPLPECIFNASFLSAFSAATAAAPAPAPAPPPIQAAKPRRAEDDGWTPVAEQQAKLDRRTFFHTEGKALTYSAGYSQGRHVEDDTWKLGERLRLVVEDVHFGNPRVRVMQNDPETIPTMLKWKPEQFEEHVVECAQIPFGDFWVWCAVGVSSNRLLYAMKRCAVKELKAVVVAPPAAALAAMAASEDIDLTYGTSCQGIQLVP